MFARLLRRWRSRAVRHDIDGGGFDPTYYRQRYPDVRGLLTVEQLTQHYVKWGRAEGRYGSRQEELSALWCVVRERDPAFDLAAYRACNHDLRHMLASETEYLRHFIEHGATEGRPCRFEAQNEAGPLPLWERLFDASHYQALCADPDTFSCNGRADALSHFREHGIGLLSPINFESRFDPEFFRTVYGVVGDLDDVALYRHWLDVGLEAGQSPNEVHFLTPILAGADFPEAFDWQSYCAEAMLDPARGRAVALWWMFTDDANLQRIAHFSYPAGIDLLIALCRFRMVRGDHAAAGVLLSLSKVREWQYPSELLAVAASLAEFADEPENALRLWTEAIDQGFDEFAALERVSEIAPRLARPEVALACLERRADSWRGDQRFHALCLGTLDRLFEHASAEAHALLGAGEANAADARMTAIIARIDEAFDNLIPAPAKLGSMPGGHVAMLANQRLPQCTFYRVEQKAERFEAAGLELRIHDDRDVAKFIDELVGAQAAIFYRVQATPNVLRAIREAREMGVPTYYEIDDLIFDSAVYPPSIATYGGSISVREYNGLRFAVPLFRGALERCDHAIASTHALLEDMRPLTRCQSGFVLRNGLDSRFPDTRPEEAPEAAGEGDGVIRIFYGSATHAHASDFAELLAPALARVLADCPNTRLVLSGHVPLSKALAQQEGRVTRLPLIPDIAAYWWLLGKCDINLAVLCNGRVEDAKSEIKWLEAAAQSIPSVVSPTKAYREQLSDGHDVLFAADIEEWYEAIVGLVRDPERRARIGRNAHAKAHTRFSTTATSALIRDHLAMPPQEPSSVGNRKLRVLVCNVFFPPQSIGGATLVVARSVADLSRSHPFIDQAVWTSDVWSGETFRTSTSDFDGVPVFRLVLPEQADTPIAHQEEIVRHFRKVLDHFAPDLVHFHSIDRMGSGVVAEARRRGLPYVITLHDAWWFSPHQFLVDRAGSIRMPQSDPLLAPALDPAELSEIAFLRTRHDPLMKDAAACLAVSASFASICRQAGVSKLRVLENGMPDLPAPGPFEVREGPLRIAHVGGRTRHKGADLVEASLRLGHYDRLELVMIDGSVLRGTQREVRWGETRVVLRPPLNHEQMPEFYRSIDVLLAPSTWPESYGLVSREALHFGNWVVAGSLGAMGEDIQPGVNGSVIETADRRNLDRVLSQMQADPGAYRRSRERSIDTRRKVRDQSDDLARLYCDVAEWQP
jgi:glycosyltransferase involved in cell wall biosynthesis